MARKMKLGPKVETTKGEPKKRGRPRKAQATLSNVTDETIRLHTDAIVAADRDVRLAREKLKARKEAAKEAGVTLTDVAWFLRAKDRDVRDIDAETRRRNRLAKIMNMPLGTQLGLWDDGKTVASKIEDDKIPTAKKIPTLAELRAARDAGAVAGRAGRNDNPHGDGSPLSLSWEEGRRAATIERAAEVFGGKSSEELAGESVDGMRALRDTEVAGAA